MVSFVKKGWKIILIALLFMFNGTLLGFLIKDTRFSQKEGDPPASQNLLEAVSSSVDQFNKEWLGRIERVGAASAYQEFLTAYAVTSQNTQHMSAHLFGNVLYKSVGLAGITVCDHRFEAGCYHEFLGRAIQEGKVDIVPRLNEECLKTAVPDWCQHGVGHGLVGYLGYGYAELAAAVEVCGQLPRQSRVGGCLGGVFMEYNSKLLVTANGGAGGNIRPFDEALGFHYPCNTIDERFREACYFRQPQWWMLSLFSNKWDDKKERIDMFRRMGELCNEAEGASRQEYCYRGLGMYGVIAVNGDIKEMILACKSMPTIKWEIECRGSAAHSSYFNLISLETQFSMCDGLSPTDYERCVSIARSPE